jgi:hypothetical protein
MSNEVDTSQDLHLIRFSLDAIERLMRDAVARLASIDTEVSWLREETEGLREDLKGLAAPHARETV